jgi:hypothetical protein
MTALRNAARRSTVTLCLMRPTENMDIRDTIPVPGGIQPVQITQADVDACDARHPPVRLYWLVYGQCAVGVRARSPKRAVEVVRGRGKPESVLVVTEDGIKLLEGV